jgi:hypothetical protein
VRADYFSEQHTVATCQADRIERVDGPQTKSCESPLLAPDTQAKKRVLNWLQSTHELAQRLFLLVATWEKVEAKNIFLSILLLFQVIF